MYKKFKEFVAEKLAEDINMAQPMSPQQTVRPGQTMQIQKDLQALQKMPAPPGMNPQQYQQRVLAAMKAAKLAPQQINSAGAAVNTAVAQQQMVKPQ